MYIRRQIEQVINEAAGQFPALIVTGPRQSGKTTLLKHLFSKSHRYVTMDEPRLRLLASEEPALFFENYPPPLIIDEVQYAPDIFSYIKILVDRNREVPGQFILTGSQSFPLMSRVSESLAGRLAVFTLLGFSYSEQVRSQRKTGISHLEKIALKGGFPEIVTREKLNVRLWFSSYLQTYLERDVRQLRQIGDLTDFQRFLQILAAFNGQVINLSSLSRDLGVAVNTVKAWISVMEASGQIFSLKPYYINKGKRIIKSPKIYFLDTGLLCYLSGITSPGQVLQGVGSGQMFETIVLGEIIRTYLNRGMIPGVYFWRTSRGEEVDFILEDRGKLIPLEVKLTSRVTMKMTKGLFSFQSLFQEKVEKGFIITLTGDELKLDGGISALPFPVFVKNPLLLP